jgi:hypothetical protein
MIVNSAIILNTRWPVRTNWHRHAGMQALTRLGRRRVWHRFVFPFRRLTDCRRILSVSASTVRPSGEAAPSRGERRCRGDDGPNMSTVRGLRRCPLAPPSGQRSEQSGDRAGNSAFSHFDDRLGGLRTVSCGVGGERTPLSALRPRCRASCGAAEVVDSRTWPLLCVATRRSAQKRSLKLPLFSSRHCWKDVAAESRIKSDHLAACASDNSRLE